MSPIDLHVKLLRYERRNKLGRGDYLIVMNPETFLGFRFLATGEPSDDLFPLYKDFEAQFMKVRITIDERMPLERIAFRKINYKINFGILKQRGETDEPKNGVFA